MQIFYIRKLPIVVLPLFLITFFGILSPLKVFAQEDVSIGMSPTYQNLKLQPGSKYTGELVTWNLSQESAKYKILVKGFKQIENTPGTAVLLSDEEEQKALYSAASWITVNRDTIELVPNKNEKILYEINVPQNATKGEYHAMISLISENYAKSPDSATFTNVSSGMPILIKIGDNFVESAELISFKTTKNIYEKPSVSFTTIINNTGDTHISPTGEIVLTNIFNKEIARIKFNANSQSLLRDNTGNYTTQWTDKLITENKQLAIGPIKAELIVTYRELQPGFAPLIAQTSFYIIPWKWILLFAIVIVLIVVLVRVKKHKKRLNSHK
ncbi:MAG TPA: hypothetical protein PLD77_00120 [Candidatus Dojkabacteria bacterium]|nr:hypothetical protein [Candidatus Dojkabacteria bacterium]